MNFKVFKDGKELDSFDVVGAYLFGSDGIAIRKGQVEFADGAVRCSGHNLDTSGLVLLWPVDGFGRVLLPTTCLPKRERPYCLNVELARGKLMQIVNKCEDWAYYTKDGLGQKFDEARELLIEAINNIADMPRASKLADEALKIALDFAEQLATKHGEAMFRIRAKNRGFGRGCIGINVQAENTADKQYVDRLCNAASFAVVPINWAVIEKNKGEYDFSESDRCLLALAKKRIALGAGPLLRFNEKYIPEWMTAKDYSFEKIRESAYRFVSAVAARYANRVRTWTVVSGLNRHNCFGFSFEQVLELTRAANMAVKTVDGRIRKIVEVENPWGEYYATMPGSIPPLIYMDMVVQSGIQFDAFCLRMDLGDMDAGLHSRDMMQVSAMLDFLSPIAKPFLVSNAAVPVDSVAAAGIGSGENQSMQADWLERFYTIVLSKPFVESVIYSRLSDSKDVTGEGTGLLTKDYEPKPAYERLKKIGEFIQAKKKTDGTANAG
ncbi:MAG: endo-1,4-beta-xylanase [Phycisphaerae bacterium]